MFLKNKLKAFLLYHSLPLEYRYNLHFFLQTYEWNRLFNGKKNLKNLNEKEKVRFFNEISYELKKIPKQSHSNRFAIIYFLIHIILSIVFLPASLENLKNGIFENSVSLILIFYAFFGSYIIFNRSVRYWKIIFRGIPISGLTILLSGFVYILLILLVGSLSIEMETRNITSDYFILAVFAGPFFEELFFRDFLYRSFYLKEKRLSLLSIILPSILFAMVHLTGFFLWEFFIYFLSGIFLALLRWQSTGLIYPILVHSFSNLFFLTL